MSDVSRSINAEFDDRATPESGGIEPGVAPDGRPVEVYCRLPPGEEPDIVHEAVPEGAAVLELGCGAGRLTRALVALGHPVVAVDESPEMIRHVHGAETVLADIETLELGRRFPVVLLASNLVNAQEPHRGAFLRACRRHVGDEGQVLIQRLEPDVDWAPLRKARYGSVAVLRSRSATSASRAVCSRRSPSIGSAMRFGGNRSRVACSTTRN